MPQRLLELILEESKWLPLSMGIAILAASALLLRSWHSDLPRRQLRYAAMTLYFGVAIGVMACGHLLAVYTKLALGTLPGSIIALTALGVLLAVPSWWLVVQVKSIVAPGGDRERRSVVLNVWLAMTLLAMGLHNWPLATPGLLNVSYRLCSRKRLGWAIIALALIVNVGLFAASLVFLASGQTFEQFRDIK